MAAVGVTFLWIAGCETSSTRVDGGGGAGDGRADSAGDAATDPVGDEPRLDSSDDVGGNGDVAAVDADRGVPFTGETAAFVAVEVTFTADRVCDLDGDGVGDNAVAELGEPGSASALMLWNAQAEAALEDGYGPGLYFPNVDDGGESVLVALSGDGTARGDELRAPFESMDGCGEPVFLYRGSLIADGELSLEAGEYPALVSDAVAPGSARVTGRLTEGEGGATLTTVECVAPTIASLGRTLGPTQTRGLSLLEVVLAGGSALGMAGAPGLSPDVDVDGDGLERVILDADGHVARCVDGDSTVIEGRDCWADDRIADAVALTRRGRYEETTFAGRFSGWMGYCEEGYPESSLFGDVYAVTAASRIVAGEGHSCLLDDAGQVRCWGQGNFGQLGYGNTDSIGDDEPACTGGVVDLGEGALSIMASGDVTCAILPGLRVRCWGDYGAESGRIGDDETPADGEDLDLGAPVLQMVAGQFHYCALLSGGRVRCWGDDPEAAAEGRLGQGSTEPIPAAEAPFAPDVDVGGRVVSLTAGAEHTCAILEDGAVRCWGSNPYGQLGYGHTENIGDDETPAEAGNVQLGGRAVALSSTFLHNCAILEGGSLRCWGWNIGGRLGYGTIGNVGDDETPASMGDVIVGGTTVSVIAGSSHSCAVLEGGGLRCWGTNQFGVAGTASPENIGDDETPADAPLVDVGGSVHEVTAGILHTCALLTSGQVRCWGYGGAGALGYGNDENIGDDEDPATAGDVPVLCDP